MRVQKIVRKVYDNLFKM